MIDYRRIDKWIQLCEYTESGDLVFTQEFITATKPLGGSRRELASQLVMGWDDDRWKGLLNYFGPDDAEEDWYTGIDGEPMDVCEDVPNILADEDKIAEGLDVEWYRDLYRAQLATIKIPRRILESYVEKRTGRK